MRKTSKPGRLGLLGHGAVALAALACMAWPGAQAQDGGSLIGDGPGGIFGHYGDGHYDDRDDCRYWGDCRRRHEEHKPPPPFLPGTEGHPTFLVKCGAEHGDEKRGLYRSLQEAVDAAPAYATILIMPPGQGTTCRERDDEPVYVHLPLTIGTYGAGSDQRAVIQAPPGRPCILANIALGDALVIDGVRFIARGGTESCVKVQAGHVIVRHSEIDSRTRQWAFDVLESGELTVESTHVQTDSSGIRAWRARVNLHDVDIDIENRHVGSSLALSWSDCTGEDEFADPSLAYDPRHRAEWAHHEHHEEHDVEPVMPNDYRDKVQGAIGLSLQCTNGSADSVSVTGGDVGIVASAGTSGLDLTDAKIRKSRTAMLLLRGQAGSITVARPALSKNTVGIIVSPGAESQISGAVITDSADAGISIYGTDTLVTGNKIIGAANGIELYPASAFPPRPVDLPPKDCTGEESAGCPGREHQPPRMTDLSANPRLANDPGAKPIVENNLIANVRHAAVRIDARYEGELLRMRGRVIGNTFYARGAKCIDDEYDGDPVEERANTCNKSWFSWPF